MRCRLADCGGEAMDPGTRPGQHDDRQSGARGGTRGDQGGRHEPGVGEGGKGRDAAGQHQEEGDGAEGPEARVAHDLEGAGAVGHAQPVGAVGQAILVQRTGRQHGNRNGDQPCRHDRQTQDRSQGEAEPAQRPHACPDDREQMSRRREVDQRQRPSRRAPAGG